MYIGAKWLTYKNHNKIEVLLGEVIPIHRQIQITAHKYNNDNIEVLLGAIIHRPDASGGGGKFIVGRIQTRTKYWTVST